MEREKKTFSGPLLEVDFYPVFNDGRRLPTRAAKCKPSTAEQKRYNTIKATKKFIRKANTNFDGTDYLMHPTYIPELAPQSEEEARRDIVNWLRRVKTKRASELRRFTKQLAAAREIEKNTPNNSYILSSVRDLESRIERLNAPFKYMYVIEKQVYKTGPYAGRVNWHFHLFMTGGLDNKTLEQMWTNGIRTNCNNYQPEKFGPEAAARYMSKDPQGSKRFSCSRNLEPPKTPPPKDGKLSKREVEKLATQRVDDARYWERRYKGYRFIRCYARYNKYNGHWYVSAVLYKTGGELPEWKEQEWITTDFT